MARLPLVAIMAAYNEADIIGAAVAHLVRQGAYLYLLDDGSTDGTVDAARAAAGDRLIGWESLADPADSRPSRFRWSHILERKAALAASIDADWFIHQDADEFRESPWPHLTLAESVGLVGRLGWNAIEFEVFNFAPAAAFAPGDDLAATFTRFLPAGAFDRVQIRCWQKTGGRVDLVSTGGHEAQFPERRVFPIRFPMRHYPIRTVAQGERKIFRERKERFEPEERARGWHVQYDRFSEGQPIEPDASALRAYDADAALVGLQVKNRLVDALCPAVAPGQREDLATSVGEIEADIVRQGEHLRGLTEAVHQLGAERDALQRELEDRERRLDEQRGWLRDALDRAASLERDVRAAHDETALVNRNALELDARLEAVFASRSWRLTRPLRAAWRLLGGS